MGFVGCSRPIGPHDPRHRELAGGEEMTPSSAFGTLDSPGKGWVPQFPYPLNYLWWGARALWLEAFGFRFDYPIELVPEAGPRSSLHYYIYSDRLFFDMMELDANGVPCHRTRTLKTFYNPAYVAWYGLMKLEQRLRSGETACEAFWTQIKWLVDHGVSQADGSAVWCFPVDFQEGRALLKSPWVSIGKMSMKAGSGQPRMERFFSKSTRSIPCHESWTVFFSASWVSMIAGSKPKMSSPEACLTREFAAWSRTLSFGTMRTDGAGTDLTVI